LHRDDFLRFKQKKSGFEGKNVFSNKKDEITWVRTLSYNENEEVFRILNGKFKRLD
jgi:hypothetical protein